MSALVPYLNVKNHVSFGPLPQSIELCQLWSLTSILRLMSVLIPYLSVKTHVSFGPLSQRIES